MILIHWDFTTDCDVSYVEGKNIGDGFSTNCLEFFSFEYLNVGVLLIDKVGNQLMLSDLLKENSYIEKEIRITHNVRKMLVANAFDWQVKK